MNKTKIRYKGDDIATTPAKEPGDITIPEHRPGDIVTVPQSMAERLLKQPNWEPVTQEKPVQNKKDGE